MRSSIEFTEPSNEICKFIEAITGSQHPLDIAVMRHWIWQVKRKFKKMETKHHIMPILHGRTRSGKTTAIERLIEPIKQLSMIAELAMVNDSRNDFNLIEKLVIFFDELGKAEKVVVSNLKQKITSSTITYRRLGTNQNMNGFNMCSFIGASNDAVIDTIVDPTSARRFYEMKTLDKCDWKMVNSLNYLEIWQSVNEMEETAPIEQHLFELSQSQEEIRAKDYVEEFVHEYNLVPDQGEHKFVSTMDLYMKLKEWLETQNKGMYIPSVSKFSRKLKSFLEKAPVTWTNGATLNGFFVCKSYNSKQVITLKEVSFGGN
jgi:predicted P-loop ATPase